MKQTKHSKPTNPTKHTAPPALKKPRQKAVGMDLDPLSIRDVNELDPSDANFESELEYDGYDEIGEYDNDAFGLNVNGRGDPEKPLNFSGREEDESISIEENLLDTQGNVLLPKDH